MSMKRSRVTRRIRRRYSAANAAIVGYPKPLPTGLQLKWAGSIPSSEWTAYRRALHSIKAAGVEFVQDPTAEDGLVIATLKDPEGNLVQLFEYGGA